MMLLVYYQNIMYIYWRFRINSEYTENLRNILKTLYTTYDIISILSECYVYLWEIPY